MFQAALGWHKRPELDSLINHVKAIGNYKRKEAALVLYQDEIFVLLRAFSFHAHSSKLNNLVANERVTPLPEL